MTPIMQTNVMNAWNHLPNAKHIDRVLASLKANPEKWAAAAASDADYHAAWNAAWDAAWNAAWNAAWYAAYDAALNAGRREAYDAAHGAARNSAYYLEYGAARNAARKTMLALIAYDDCAHMLDSTPDDLRILHALGEERTALFIPAAIIFSLEKELV